MLEMGKGQVRRAFVIACGKRSRCAVLLTWSEKSSVCSVCVAAGVGSTRCRHADLLLRLMSPLCSAAVHASQHCIAVWPVWIGMFCVLFKLSLLCSQATDYLARVHI